VVFFGKTRGITPEREKKRETGNFRQNKGHNSRTRKVVQSFSIVLGLSFMVPDLVYKFKHIDESPVDMLIIIL